VYCKSDGIFILIFFVSETNVNYLMKVFKKKRINGYYLKVRPLFPSTPPSRFRRDTSP
jgi:hypothetical protein